VKGAFTGAINSKRGAILEAHKGTLFLDEIDSLTLDLQTKLLLFLDNYEVRAVGGESVSKADVRMIFASGSRLAKKVEDAQMRKDFYYRLQAGCSITLESLRERPARIQELCHSFENSEAVVFDLALVEFFASCAWPGNIRQLQSHLMKKKILSEGKKITFDEVDKELIQDKFEPVKQGAIQPLEKMKINYCHDAFLKMDKNITRTAKLLELCPNTLKAYLSRKNEK
jgi:transcriptional regulator with PAS, ATPase and Fis domain